MTTREAACSSQATGSLRVRGRASGASLQPPDSSSSDKPIPTREWRTTYRHWHSTQHIAVTVAWFATISVVNAVSLVRTFLVGLGVAEVPSLLGIASTYSVCLGLLLKGGPRMLQGCCIAVAMARTIFMLCIGTGLFPVFDGMKTMVSLGAEFVMEILYIFMEQRNPTTLGIMVPCHAVACFLVYRDLEVAMPLARAILLNTICMICGLLLHSHNRERFQKLHSLGSKGELGSHHADKGMVTAPSPRFGKQGLGPASDKAVPAAPSSPRKLMAAALTHSQPSAQPLEAGDTGPAPPSPETLAREALTAVATAAVQDVGGAGSGWKDVAILGSEEGAIPKAEDVASWPPAPWDGPANPQMVDSVRAMQRAFAPARPKYKSSLGRVQVCIKIPSADPEQLPDRFALHLNSKLQQRSSPWVLAHGVARRGCIQLVLDLLGPWATALRKLQILPGRMARAACGQQPQGSDPTWQKTMPDPRDPADEDHPYPCRAKPPVSCCMVPAAHMADPAFPEAFTSLSDPGTGSPCSPAGGMHLVARQELVDLPWVKWLDLPALIPDGAKVTIQVGPAPGSRAATLITHVPVTSAECGTTASQCQGSTQLPGSMPSPEVVVPKILYTSPSVLLLPEAEAAAAGASDGAGAGAPQTMAMGTTTCIELLLNLAGVARLDLRSDYEVVAQPDPATARIMARSGYWDVKVTVMGTSTVTVGTEAVQQVKVQVALPAQLSPGLLVLELWHGPALAHTWPVLLLPASMAAVAEELMGQLEDRLQPAMAMSASKLQGPGTASSPSTCTGFQLQAMDVTDSAGLEALDLITSTSQLGNAGGAEEEVANPQEQALGLILDLGTWVQFTQGQSSVIQGGASGEESTVGGLAQECMEEQLLATAVTMLHHSVACGMPLLADVLMKGLTGAKPGKGPAGASAGAAQASRQEAASSGSKGSVSFLTFQDVITDAQDAAFEGWTLMHRAAVSGCMSTVMLVVGWHQQFGQPLGWSRQCHGGLTPLHVVALHQHGTEFVGQLFEAFPELLLQWYTHDGICGYPPEKIAALLAANPLDEEV